MQTLITIIKQKILLLAKSLSLLGLALAQVGFAAEISVENNLKVLTQHSDNIELTPENEKSLQGRTVRPSIVTKIADGTWDTSLSVDLSFNNFNRSEYDSDDQFVTLSANKRTERQQFGLIVNATRDSTRTSEQDTSGVVSNSAIRREVYAVSPRWSYNLSEKTYISADARISETEYKSQRFTNYDYDSLSLSVNRFINDKFRFTVQLRGTDYQPDERVTNYFNFFDLGTKSESKSYGAEIGGEYTFNEKWTVNGLVGSTYTDQEYTIRDPQGACDIPNPDFVPQACDIEDFSGSSLTADVSANWTGEQNELTMSYSINNQPSSQGYEVEYERYQFNWRYKHSDRSTWISTLKYGSNNAVDTSAASIDPRNNNRDFGSVDLSYVHRLTKTINLNMRYGYRWQDRELSIDSAESDTISLGINYTPTKSIW